MTQPAPEPSPQARPTRPARGPIAILRDLFSSVWFGIALISVLFIYMSVGSAIPPMRQLRIFEMTEFEWFNWWPFTVMIALICINITVATLRRIPLTTINLGVWMIHTGIVALCITGAYYFATKVEGDTPVIRRQVVIETADGVGASLPAVPGARTQAGAYTFEVAQVDPTWPILSGEDAGQRAFSVSVLVTHPERRFIRQMLAGFPQYTEDILPGVGRVVRQTGERLLDKSLTMGLDYLPQDAFYIMHSRALYVREAAEPGAQPGPWQMRPLRGLPRYNDYVEDPATEVWVSASDTPPPSDPLSKPVPPAGPDDPLADTPIRVTGFLRYAVMEERWRPGGDTLNPAVDVIVRSTTGTVRRFPLMAFQEGSNTTPGGEIALVWVEDESQFERLTLPPDRALTIEIPGAGATVEADTELTASTNPSLDFTPIEESGWLYRVRFFADDLPVADGRLLSVAVVEFRDPEGVVFTRWVSDDMAFVRDMPEGAGDFGEAMPTRRDVVARYEPGGPGAPVTIVAGPPGRDSLRFVISDGPQGTRVASAPVGGTVELGAGMTVQVAAYSQRARMEARPRIIPKRQRDRDAGEMLSMLEIELDDGDHVHRYWLPYNHYMFPTTDFNYPGRFLFRPMTLNLHDGRRVEVAFGRERRELPAPVVLDDFVLTTRIGGFTGEVSSIRDWTSEIRFLVDGEWTPTMEVSTNDPASIRGLSFFQASWDPPRPATGPEDPGSAGLAFTGLGVGNRNGVNSMLAACTLAVTGMFYAFYVKPILKRRRVRLVHEQVARERAAESAPSPETPEAVSV
ncbi:MAG: hypothetical protein ACF8QF_00225 [Phycisphaerales bacterium]